MSRAAVVRVVVVVALGVAYAWYADAFRMRHALPPSDFTQPRLAAGLLVQGRNPYAEIGPDRPVAHPFYLIYPATAAVVAMPFTAASPRFADAVFVGLGVAALAWALTRRTLKNPQLLVFTSFAMTTAAQNVQWSPLMTAATAMTSLGFVYACKPSVGLAYLAAYPSRRAILGSAIFALLTITIWPWWPSAWVHELGTVTHMSAPVMRPGGPLLLLSLLRWRRPEARLVAALACIPQTAVLYEALPLFLVVTTLREATALTVLMQIGGLIVNHLGAGRDYNAWMTLSGNVMVWAAYLPCVVMILRRPNEASATVPTGSVPDAAMAAA